MEANLSTLIVGLLTQFVLGAALGWWTRSIRPVEAAPKQKSDELKRLVEENRQQAEEMHEAMSKIHELTDNIGRDVGDHAGRVQQISSGLSTAVNDKGGVELQAALIDAVSEVSKANEQLQTQLQDAEKRLQDQSKAIEKHIAAARTDALTGILNRRAFDEEITRRVAEFQRYRTPCALMLGDIDYFKKFNDVHGHQAGDEVLKLTAKTLSNAMRDVDLVCRYGGEEFAVIMPGTELAGGGMAAERARAAIERALIEFGGKQLKVTLSAGVGVATPGEDITSLIKRVDEALYESKRAGRNCAHLHDGTQMHRGVLPLPAPTSEPKPVVEPTPAKPGPKSSLLPPDDSLCQLPNSEAFHAEVSRRLEQQRKYQTPVTLIFGSVDDFAGIRATYDDEGAQKIMRAAAQFLKTAVRDNDTLARVADDRFAIVLPGIEVDKAQHTAERVRQAVEKCGVPLAGDIVRFTISFGIVEAEIDELTHELISRAISALDAAILGGGDRIVRGPAVTSTIAQP